MSPRNSSYSCQSRWVRIMVPSGVMAAMSDEGVSASPTMGAYSPSYSPVTLACVARMADQASRQELMASMIYGMAGSATDFTSGVPGLGRRDVGCTDMG